MSSRRTDQALACIIADLERKMAERGGDTLIALPLDLVVAMFKLLRDWRGRGYPLSGKLCDLVLTRARPGEGISRCR